MRGGERISRVGWSGGRARGRSRRGRRHRAVLYCSPRHGGVKLSALFYLVLPMIYGGVTFPALARCRTELRRRSPSTVSPPPPWPGDHKSAAGWEMGTSWHGSCLHRRGARWQHQPKSCSLPSERGGEAFFPWHLLVLTGGMLSDGKTLSWGDGVSSRAGAASGVAPMSPGPQGRGAPQWDGGFLLHPTMDGRGTGASPVMAGSPNTTAGGFVVLGTPGTSEGFCLIYQCCRLARVAASFGLAPTLSVCLALSEASCASLSWGDPVTSCPCAEPSAVF